MNPRRPALLLATLLLTAACGDRTDQPPEAAETTAEPGAQQSHAADDHGAGAEQTGGAHGEGQALLPIMQHLGSQMNALTYALMTDDTATVASSAAAIAAHAPIATDELERIHAVLGPDLASFEALDESVHVASIRLSEAARAGQLDTVVERLGDVQRGCVACHARFREPLRADREGAVPD